MAVNDIWSVAVESTLHAQKIVNVFHYRESVTGANPPVDLATAFNTNIIPLMKACWSNELTFNQLILQKIWPLPPLVPNTSITAAGAGSVAQSSLPTSVAAVITKTTSFAGRKYRGRVFMAGVPITFEADSLLTAGAQTTYNALATALSLNQTGGGTTMVPIIWHKGPKTNDTVTSCFVRAVLRNQRRRQIGKGV